MKDEADEATLERVPLTDGRDCLKYEQLGLQWEELYKQTGHLMDIRTASVTDAVSNRLGAVIRRSNVSWKLGREG